MFSANSDGPSAPWYRCAAAARSVLTSSSPAAPGLIRNKPQQQKKKTLSHDSPPSPSPPIHSGASRPRVDSPLHCAPRARDHCVRVKRVPGYTGKTCSSRVSAADGAVGDYPASAPSQSPLACKQGAGVASAKPHTTGPPLFGRLRGRR